MPMNVQQQVNLSNQVKRAKPGEQHFIKRVSWLELFFDLIFALALAMAAKPLENLGGLSGKDLLLNIGQFLFIYIFLIVFWYRHTNLMNRFEYMSFTLSGITLLIGILIIGFTQFMRIWVHHPYVGSTLATITMSLSVFLIAVMYFYMSKRSVYEGLNERKWAIASAKHMFWEALFYLTALLLVPILRPFALIGVFIYFNHYPWHFWINPKAQQPNVHPLLMSPPAENKSHKTERIGLFSLLVFGLVIVLAASPLLESVETDTIEEALHPLAHFAQVFFFIGLIWYLFFRVIEVAEPKGNRFGALTFIILAFTVIHTQLVRMFLETGADAAGVAMALSSALMLIMIGIMYWNIKTLQGAGLAQPKLLAFKQWSIFLYIAASVFIASAFFPTDMKITVWMSCLGIIMIGLIIDQRLKHDKHSRLSMRADFSKKYKFFDSQTNLGLILAVLGLITFGIMTFIFKIQTYSWWMAVWIIPFVIGLIIMANHWLHTRIKN